MSFAPQEHIHLAEFSNYKIGGPARYFVNVATVKKVKEALQWARDYHIKIFILGGGTNLLFDDEGFKGLVLRPSLTHITRDATRVTAGTGVSVKDFLEFCVAHGLSGFEWAGGLPGTIGGAVRGNAGAFQGETKDTVRAVASIHVGTLVEKERDKSACSFGYRASIFKTLGGEEIILSVTFDLCVGEPEEIRAAIEEKINYRAARHPLEYPNVGSMFKNVDATQFSLDARHAFDRVIKLDPFPVVPTAYLISEAGLKGVVRGSAQVSEKHPNFIVNTGGATSHDVRALIALVKKKVFEKFGVSLEEEVQIVPAQ